MRVPATIASHSSFNLKYCLGQVPPSLHHVDCFVAGNSPLPFFALPISLFPSHIYVSVEIAQKSGGERIVKENELIM
jgi:hypothetical protein